MMNLRPHRRIHIPNGLAVIAVLMLLVTAVTGFEDRQDAVPSEQQATVSTKAESTVKTAIHHAASKKTSGLKLGLRLFRRG